MKKIIFLITGIIVISPFLQAQNTSFNFLRISPHAGSRAIGDAYSSMVKDITAVEHNPAGLGYIRQRQVILSDLEWLDDFRYMNLIYGQNILSGGLAVSLSYFGMPPFPAYDAQKNTTEDINKYDLCFAAGYGQELLHDFYSGLTLRYLRSVIMEESTSAAALDAGFKYDFYFLQLFWFPAKNNCSLSVTAQNIGYTISSIDNQDKLPLCITGGLSYLLYRNLHHSIDLAFEVKKYLSDDLIPSLGLEYWLWQAVALRGGYTFNSDVYPFTAGIGIQYAFGNTELGIDLAYSPAVFNDFNEEIINASLSIKFGRAKQDTMKEKLKYSLQQNKNEIMISIDNPEVLFSSDETSINHNTYPELDEITEVIKKQEYQKVVIKGYIKAAGKTDLRSVIQKRITEISRHMAYNGIDQNRISCQVEDTPQEENEFSIKKYQIQVINWLETDRANFKYYDNSGDQAAAKKEYEQAIENWEKALKIDPLNSGLKEKIQKAREAILIEEYRQKRRKEEYE